MFSIISGAVLIGLSGTSLWYFMPRKGVLHPWITKPALDSLIVIVIMGVAALGLALIIGGVGG